MGLLCMVVKYYGFTMHGGEVLWLYYAWWLSTMGFTLHGGKILWIYYAWW